MHIKRKKEKCKYWRGKYFCSNTNIDLWKWIHDVKTSVNRPYNFILREGLFNNFETDFEKHSVLKQNNYNVRTVIECIYLVKQLQIIVLITPIKTILQTDQYSKIKS